MEDRERGTRSLTQILTGAQGTLVIDSGETEQVGGWGRRTPGGSPAGRPGAGLQRNLRNGFPRVTSPGPPSDLKRQRVALSALSCIQETEAQTAR